MKTALVLSAVFWIAFFGALAVALCAVRAADYEVLAERPGALLRADEPNIRRMGQTFPSYHDCLEAIALSRAEKGWRLRCRPVQVAPVPRIVGR